MKIRCLICFLLCINVMDVSEGKGNIGIGIYFRTYVPDDYGNIGIYDLSLINTNLNASSANYPHIIRFFLYSRSTMNGVTQLFLDDVEGLNHSPFDPKKPTIIISHGWRESYLSLSCIYVRDAYLKHGDYNVIVIDWSAISQEEYIWSKNQIPSIARFNSRMIDYLVSQGMDPSELTMVGHSLGAHLVGLSSYYAKHKANYVVGLDPAGPLYTVHEPRISADDATFVEVIHTSNTAGWSIQLGHVDFYPNGGIIQSNCNLPVSCPHRRSYDQFAESIGSSHRFLARRCDNYLNYVLGVCNSNDAAYMGGFPLDVHARGRYFLTTNSIPPYARD